MHFGSSPYLHYLILSNVWISGVCLVLRAVTHNATSQQPRVKNTTCSSTLLNLSFTFWHSSIHLCWFAKAVHSVLLIRFSVFFRALIQHPYSLQRDSKVASFPDREPHHPASITLVSFGRWDTFPLYCSLSENTFIFSIIFWGAG